MILKTYANALKLKKGRNYPSEELTFSAIKGEQISFQILIIPSEDGTVDSYSTDSEFSTELFFEQYLTFETPSNQYLESGSFPDAIVPFDFGVKNGYNVLHKGDEQAILVKITVDRQTKAETKNIKLTLNISGEEYVVPFTLKIYDITMPEQNHCKSMFSIFKDGGWLTGNMQEKYNEYKEVYEMLADYRVSGTYLPTKTIELDNADIADVVAAAKEYANDKRIACYAVNYKTTTDIIDGKEFTVLDKEYFKKVLIALCENSTNECNLLKNAVLYFATITDEPAPERFPQIRRNYTDVYDIKREIANELDFSDKREVEASLLTMDNIITVFQKEPIYGSVDTWCPGFWAYSMPEYVYEGEQLRHLGFKHWFYGCISPQTPYVSYDIDDGLVQIKTLNWMQFDYNIEGNLYWAVNLCYRKTENNYDNPLDGKLSSFHGDGYLIYNPECYGKRVPSLRLNGIMEGNEDYEKLLIYRSAVEKLSEKFLKDIDCKSILRPLLDKLYDGAVVPTNESYLKYAEEQLLDLIELAENGVALEMENIQGKYAYIAVYSDKPVVFNAERISTDGYKQVVELPLDKEKNYLELSVCGKKYSLFISDEIVPVDLKELVAAGSKVCVSPFGNGGALLVKTEPFLNTEKQTTEIILSKEFDATNLDRLYVDAESFSDYECVLQGELIDKNGKAFILGYDMIKQKTRSTFSLKKQKKLIKSFNCQDGFLEGFRQREKFDAEYAGFDFKNVVAIRFFVMNDTKFLDNHRERRVPKYKFIIRNIHYSISNENDI